MIALYIIGGIIVFFALVSSLSVTLYVKQNEDLTVKVGIGGFKVFIINPNEPEKSDEEKFKEKADKKKDAEKASGNKKNKKTKEKKGMKKLIEDKLSHGNGEKRSVGEIIELALVVVKAVLPPFRDIIKHVRITSLSVKINVGAEDADETAYTYAAVSTGVYAALAVLEENIVVKVKKIELNADFVSGEIREDIFFKVKIRISVILYNAVRTLVGYIKSKG